MATKLREPPLPDYDTDGVGWADAQAAALSARRVELLDWDNLAEEIADVSKRQRDKLRSALRIIIMHLLKWDHQTERRSRSWWTSIANGRISGRARLDDNPSLRPQLAALIADAHRIARNRAADEMDVPVADLPAECPYSFDEIMTRPVEWDGEIA